MTAHKSLLFLQKIATLFFSEMHNSLPLLQEILRKVVAFFFLEREAFFKKPSLSDLFYRAPSVIQEEREPP